MRLLPRVGRRRCTPAFGPLARITRADTRPLACRSGEAPEGKLAPCYPLLPAHRTQRGRTLQAAGEASCAEYAAWRATTTDRPPAPPLPRSFPEVEGWGSTRWHAAQEEWKPSRSQGTCPLLPCPVSLQRSCPILLPIPSVNQRLPSGPAVMPTGLLLAVGTANSRILPESARALGAASVSTQMSRLKSPANREKRREM